MNTATTELADEHQLILQVVGAIEREAAGIRAGGSIQAADIENMVAFTREYTDGVHHAKEERVLFPAMRAASPVAESPVNVMLAEHEQGRAYVRAITEALPGARAGGHYAARALAAALEGYASLLRRHVSKEDRGVFPLAERILTTACKEAVVAEFARVEREEVGRGVHEWAADIADQLTRRAA